MRLPQRALLDAGEHYIEIADGDDLFTEWQPQPDSDACRSGRAVGVSAPRLPGVRRAADGHSSSANCTPAAFAARPSAPSVVASGTARIMATSR